ncbi:MAG TPA: TIGR02206 family membrane protein [Rhizomicrobium sp.]|jgi:hypothetical integral membrane protein (TIGR02206 family)|nr:TIGR02206 family membrane protein [Rhizomicrobium sp.]
MGNFNTKHAATSAIMLHPFVLFGPSHLAVIAFAIAVPLLLSVPARKYETFARVVRWVFAALIIGAWIAWYVLFASRGWLGASNEWPMNLCDWAAIATIIALVTQNRRAYELSYFWGLCGTAEALVTPDVNFDFPDAQFIVFFLGHAAIIASVLFLTFGVRMRPGLKSIPRVALWSLVYLAAAAFVDWKLGTNYGFLRGKPHQATLLAVLSPWPWYIAELVPIGILSALVCYAPFFVADNFREMVLKRDAPIPK